MSDVLASYVTVEMGLVAVVVRLGLAAVLGLMIGLDREYRAQPAGLRTHMLVSLAAATFAVLTFEIVQRIDYTQSGLNADPVRIIEAVTAGVAFLAAGTIIQARGRVHGLTTGAGLWLAGAIGLACGVGAFVVAFVATILGLVVLSLLQLIEAPLSRKKRHREDGEDNDDADR